MVMQPGKYPDEMAVCKDKCLPDRGDSIVRTSCCFEKLERGPFNQELSTLGPYLTLVFYCPAFFPLFLVRACL